MTFIDKDDIRAMICEMEQAMPRYILGDFLGLCLFTSPTKYDVCAIDYTMKDIMDHVERQEPYTNII